jgi:hypothetical protein
VVDISAYFLLVRGEALPTQGGAPVTVRVRINYVSE